MTTERPWARHYHEIWQERAGDDRLPFWLRVAALAYGSHTDNGHARYRRGEVAMILGKVDTQTGQLVPYENVGRAIEAAVEYGWLAAESFWGCLVVPAHAIKKGEHGRNPRCPIHAKRRREGRETLTERRLRALPATPSDGFGVRTAHSVTASERKAFSSLLTASATPHDRNIEESA